MTDVTNGDLYWDPYNADQREAPYDAWRRLRDEAPVYHNERFGFWALSRFADVLAASLDTESFSSARGITLDAIGEPAPFPIMIMMDPPLHDAFRKVVSRAYTPRRIAALEDRIRELCAEYLDPFVGGGGFDFVQDFGMRLPVMVISTLLGFPEEDHDQLREWSDTMLHREEGQEGMTPEAQESQNLTMTYYMTQIEQRRRQPRDDMISALTEADLVTPDGEVRKLDDLEVIGMLALISNAGNETVARMLGWASLVLDEYPDARREMADDPSLIAAGVEELLRYEAPSPIQGRYVTRPHATLVDFPVASEWLRRSPSRALFHPRHRHLVLDCDWRPLRSRRAVTSSNGLRAGRRTRQARQLPSFPPHHGHPHARCRGRRPLRG